MIPKTIHYCWLSDDPYPELIKKCIDSWMVYLTDYQFVLWDRQRSETINCEWVRQTIAKKKYAFAADYIRIYALSNYGGIYLDADVELLGSLDSFLKHNFFIGFEYNNDLEPAIFGTVAGHSWLTCLLNYYQNRSFIKKDGTIDTKPLPTIFNETALQYGFKANGKMQYINNKDIVVFPCEFFSPKNIYFKKVKTTSNTVSVHHFDGSWLIKNKKHMIKHIFHQLLYIIGGKTFHYRFTQIIRKIIQ